MIISESTFHTLLIILSTSNLYFSIFFLIIVSCGILLSQYVNSINYIIRLSSYFVGGGD